MTGVRFETDRLVLRRWRVSEASIQRELWAERDQRTPAHRRITADGHPTVAEFEERISREAPPTLGFLAAEHKQTHEVLGYSGLLANDHGDDAEPEIAYEFLRRHWGHGYATEAGFVILDWARESGYQRLWATIRDWNTASRRVAVKLGFIETERVDTSAEYGDSLYYVRDL